jgi:hypothetical protein
MTWEGEQSPVVLNDGMGGSERRRIIELPEMAFLYIECLGPMGQVVSRATGRPDSLSGTRRPCRTLSPTGMS